MSLAIGSVERVPCALCGNNQEPVFTVLRPGRRVVDLCGRCRDARNRALHTVLRAIPNKEHAA